MISIVVITADGRRIVWVVHIVNVIHDERRIIVWIRLIVELRFAHPTVTVTVDIALIPFAAHETKTDKLKFGFFLTLLSCMEMWVYVFHYLGSNALNRVSSSGRSCCIGTGASVFADFRGTQPLRRNSIKSRNMKRIRGGYFVDWEQWSILSKYWSIKVLLCMCVRMKKWTESYRQNPKWGREREHSSIWNMRLPFLRPRVFRMSV